MNLLLRFVVVAVERHIIDPNFLAAAAEWKVHLPAAGFDQHVASSCVRSGENARPRFFFFFFFFS